MFLPWANPWPNVSLTYSQRASNVLRKAHSSSDQKFAGREAIGTETTHPLDGRQHLFSHVRFIGPNRQSKLGLIGDDVVLVPGVNVANRHHRHLPRFHFPRRDGLQSQDCPRGDHDRHALPVRVGDVPQHDDAGVGAAPRHELHAHPEQLRSVDLLEDCERDGVTFVPGPDCFFGGDGGQNAARISFSFPPLGDIAVGADRLTAAARRRLSIPDDAVTI